MKKTFCSAALAFALLLGFVSCASTKAENGKSDEKSSGGVKISMTGNPTAGYSWEFSALPDGIVSVKENITYLGSDGIVGAPSRFDYVVTPLKDGEARLDFVYGRSWESGEPAVKSAYEIEVKNHKAYIKSDFAGNWKLEKLLKDDDEQNIFVVELGLDKKDGNDYSIRGSAGANVFSGEIKIDGNSADASNGFALTKMMGAPDEMEFERLYLSLFDGGLEMSTFVRNGEKVLSIVNPAENLCAEYKSAD